MGDRYKKGWGGAGTRRGAETGTPKVERHVKKEVQRQVQEEVEGQVHEEAEDKYK